jgi:O-antigen/teichoic acid export membrane protein
MSETQSKVVHGIIWTTIEKIGKQFLQFVLGIIIARLLLPSDYGTIGMLGIFMELSSAILGAGIGNALIQKQDRTEEDFSTAFYINIITGIFLYIILYLTAPLIAGFYKIPTLKSVTRVYSLTLIINSLAMVQRTRLTIAFNFKVQAIISIIALVISGLISIYFAKIGLGVWTLVFYGLIESGLSCFLNIAYEHWIPRAKFSKASFKHIFSFGSKILLSNILNTIYNNMYTLVIGKKLTPYDVGIYNRGKNFSELPPTITSQILMKVAYPLFSEMQSDENKSKEIFTKIIALESYFLAPVLGGMAIIAEPLVLLLLKDKWADCIPILQILCLGALWLPLIDVNNNLLFSKGLTGVSLKIETITKPLAIITLFASIPFGLKIMCLARAVFMILSYLFSVFMTKKYLHFSFMSQIKAVTPSIFYTFIMIAAVYFSMKLFDSYIIKITIAIITGAFTYIFLSFITRNVVFYSCINAVKTKIKRNKNHE